MQRFSINRRHTVLGAASAAGLVVLLAAALTGTAGASSPSALQAAKAAAARFQSVEQAEAAGYHGEPVCVASPEGGMGYHYFNPQLAADDRIDPLQPEVLVYAPRPNGRLELVALEYFKADADQDLSTDGDRPWVFGQPFDGPMPGHNPAMPVHYDLHVWLYEPNSSGTFAMWNPAVSCP